MDRRCSSQPTRIRRARAAAFFPDGQRVAIVAHAPNESLRTWVQALGGGDPVPLGPEGFRGILVSPDGRQVVAADNEGGVWILDVGGHGRRKLPGLGPDDRTASWSSDGRKVFFYRPAELPGRVLTYDIATDRIETFKTLATADPAGVVMVAPLVVTPDGATTVYNLARFVSDLYLVKLSP